MELELQLAAPLLLSSNRFEVCVPADNDAGGGRICPAVGGSARQRSFWLCYGREAILEICLLCYSEAVRTCVQTFAVYFSCSVYNVDDLPLRSDGPLRVLCVRPLAEVGADRSSLDYSNNNIHGI